MRNITESVQDQFVETLQERHRGVRNVAEVGEIGGTSEPEAEDFHLAVQQRHGNKRDAEKLERAMDGVQRNARHGAERWFVIEYVCKHAPDDIKRFFVAVDRQRRALTDIERANVIKTEDVVGMAMREQNGVEAFESNAEGLLAEVRRRINHDVLAAAGDQYGRTQPLIVRIIRLAHAAGAAERGNTHGRAGAENGDF